MVFIPGSARSDDVISLFQEQPPARRGVSAVALSFVLHGAGIGMISYGILHAPHVRERVVTERYSVRHLDLHEPDSTAQDDTQGKIRYPGKDAGKAPLEEAMAGDPDPEAQLPQPPETAAGAGGKQTLLQPEFHTHQVLREETPVPTVVIWTPELASKKQIVAPLPDMPTAATAKPALDPPNEELKVADAAVAATTATPKIATPPAGTTSPLVTRVPSLVQMAPATVSVSTEQPTPTAVLSISDLRMTDGSVTLPPVNETRTRAAAAQPAPVQAKGGAGKALSASATAKATTSNPPPVAAAVGSAKADPAQGKADGGDSAPGNTVHITQPRDGKFSVVVVGTSLAEEYPETLQVWNDRVAYTAYLHVGLARNWILQYAQAQSTDGAGAESLGRLEAPWPYDILRPNLISGDLNADALMIHGVVNQDGRFEKLAVAFPTEFDHASFVLHALQQWQFRPARQNGKATAVEVLLIIPDELE